MIIKDEKENIMTENDVITESIDDGIVVFNNKKNMTNNLAVTDKLTSACPQQKEKEEKKSDDDDQNDNNEKCDNNEHENAEDFSKKAKIQEKYDDISDKEKSNDPRLVSFANDDNNESLSRINNESTTLGNYVDNHHDDSSWYQDTTINADDNNNYKADANKIINIDGDDGVNDNDQVNHAKNRNDKNEDIYDDYDSSFSEDDNYTATVGNNYLFSSNEALKKENEEDGEEQENCNDNHTSTKSLHSFYDCAKYKQKENNLRTRKDKLDRWRNVKSFFVPVVDNKIDTGTTIPFILFERDINDLRRVCNNNSTKIINTNNEEAEVSKNQLKEARDKLKDYFHNHVFHSGMTDTDSIHAYPNFAELHKAVRNQVVIETKSPQDNINCIDINNNDDDDDATLFHFLYCSIQIPEQPEEEEKDLDYTTTRAVSDKQNEKRLQIHNNKTMSTPKWQTDNPSVAIRTRRKRSASCRLGIMKKMNSFKPASLDFDNSMHNLSRSLNPFKFNTPEKYHDVQDRSLDFDNSLYNLDVSDITTTTKQEDPFTVVDNNSGNAWYDMLKSIFPCFQNNYKGY